MAKIEAVADQRRCCRDPKYFCIECEEQVCHLCANVFHVEHKVIPIYTGEMIASLDGMVHRVLAEHVAGGVA